MVEYDIIRAGSREELVEKVNIFIKDDWRPIGGIAVMVYKHISILYQAVMRIEVENGK